VRLDWWGKAGCLFAATQKYDAHHAIVGQLGDRFLLFRIETLRDEQLAKCELQLGDISMDEEIAQAVGDLFAALPDPPPEPERMDSQERSALAKTLRLVIRLRAGVVRDGFRREIDDVHDPEGPGRMSIALQQLFAGLILIGVERIEACAIVGRVALDFRAQAPSLGFFRPDRRSADHRGD
jgi:hypothetical protein